MTLLTPDELVALTGTRLPSKQMKVLRENGIKYCRRLDNRPSVTWAAVNAVLVGMPPASDTAAPRLEWIHGPKEKEQ